MPILWHREQAHRGFSDRAQHFLAGWRLAAAILEQKGAVNAPHRAAIDKAGNGDHPGPTTTALIIGQIGVEQKIRCTRVFEAARLQVGFCDAACNRLTIVPDAADFQGMVGFGARR